MYAKMMIFLCFAVANYLVNQSVANDTPEEQQIKDDIKIIYDELKQRLGVDSTWQLTLQQLQAIWGDNGRTLEENFPFHEFTALHTGSISVEKFKEIIEQICTNKGKDVVTYIDGLKSQFLVRLLHEGNYKNRPRL